MANKTKHAIGLVMGILGIALLLLNAASYLMKWEQTSPAILPIGIMFAILGVGLMKRSKDNEKKQ